jgi:hypothetical protein
MQASTVSSAARPGATSLGPPEKPAKKCEWAEADVQITTGFVEPLLPRWVPVATRITTSSRRTIPSSSASTAGIIRCRGCGRVPSQADIATDCPGRTRSRSGGPATGERNAVVRTPAWSDDAS